MFRRIELIHQGSASSDRRPIDAAIRRGYPVDPALRRFWKSGLMTPANDAVVAAWAGMNRPRRAIFRNCRFYFTEEGWRRYGRATIAACQQSGQGYRVIRVKERSVDVVYRDKVQVAARNRKRKTDTSKRRLRSGS